MFRCARARVRTRVHARVRVCVCVCVRAGVGLRRRWEEPRLCHGRSSARMSSNSGWQIELQWLLPCL